MISHLATIHLFGSLLYSLAEDDYYDEDEAEAEADDEPEAYSLAKMLNNRNDDDYYGYDDPYD